MTQRCFRLGHVALGIGLSGLWTVLALAQPPVNPGGRNLPPQRPAFQGGQAVPRTAGVEPRPAPDELVVRELDPKLDEILKMWEQKSAKIQVLQGDHARYEYNNVFSVEKRTKGRFFYAAPDQGRIDIEGIPFSEGAKSQTIDPNTHKPYNLGLANDEGWICTGQEVLVLTPAVKEYEVFPIPKEMQGQRIIDSPLPFLFGLKAAEAKRRFDLTLRGENAKTYVIEAVPRRQMDAQNYKSAMIALDKATFIPVAVQVLDQAGTTLTKYYFSNVEVNPEPSTIKKFLPFFKDPDPFHPDLRRKGWKRILPPAAVEPAGNEVPAGQRTSSQRPTGAIPASGSRPLPPPSRSFQP